MRPSIGRIIIYREPEGVRDCAAIITAVEDSGVYLLVFPPSGLPYVVDPPAGVAQCPQGGAIVPGTWRWPERV